MSKPHKETPFLTRQTVRKPVITVAEPYPLLDPGEYLAYCTNAAYEWAKRYNAWKARLVFEPLNYTGRPYTGKLCKFFDLGKNFQEPYAGPRSAFRTLLVQLNGEQPTRPDVDMSILEGRLYRITVETVNKNRNNEPLSAEHWYSTVRKIHPVAPSKPSNPHNPGNLGNLLTDQPSNLDNLPLGKSSAPQRQQDRKDKFG